MVLNYVRCNQTSMMKTHRGTYEPLHLLKVFGISKPSSRQLLQDNPALEGTSQGHCQALHLTFPLGFASLHSKGTCFLPWKRLWEGTSWGVTSEGELKFIPLLGHLYGTTQHVIHWTDTFPPEVMFCHLWEYPLQHCIPFLYWNGNPFGSQSSPQPAC